MIELLAIPTGSKPIAILCIGHAEEFYDEPMLQKMQWAERVELETLVMENTWKR